MIGIYQVETSLADGFVFFVQAFVVLTIISVVGVAVRAIVRWLKGDDGT